MSRRGFTLIELMIVIAIIATIAAIAIPGLLQSQRASNERSASASLKTLATANADFRSNDRDSNHVNDYWTRDVRGLFTVYPSGGTLASAIKLIELSLAGADAQNLPAIAPTASNGAESQISNYTNFQPKAGFWYFHLWWDMSTSPPGPYGVNTDTSGWAIHNDSIFAFGAWPDSYSSGRTLFILNEGNTLYKRGMIATCRPGALTPPGWLSTTGFANGGVTPPWNWPDNAGLKANYGKMD